MHTAPRLIVVHFLFMMWEHLVTEIRIVVGFAISLKTPQTDAIRKTVCGGLHYLYNLLFEPYNLTMNWECNQHQITSASASEGGQV